MASKIVFRKNISILIYLLYATANLINNKVDCSYFKI